MLDHQISIARDSGKDELMGTKPSGRGEHIVGDRPVVAEFGVESAGAVEWVIDVHRQPNRRLVDTVDARIDLRGQPKGG